MTTWVEWILSQLAILAESGYEAVTGHLISFQLVILLLVIAFTWIPLWWSGNQASKIGRDLGKLRAQHGLSYALAEEKIGNNSKLALAWSRSVGAQLDTTQKYDALYPEVAFEPARLLSNWYVMRWDVAAPGLFTALGILGTFIGLLIGFQGVDTDMASESIGVLIGGMTVAFLNSIVGVSLSVLWAFLSRFLRHRYDLKVGKLTNEIENWFDWRGTGYQLHSGLSAIEERLSLVVSRLDDVREASERSSSALIEGISPQLTESLQSLVSTPFTQLTESVVAFDEIVNRASVDQTKIAGELVSAVASLSATKNALVESLETAKSCVNEFENSVQILQNGALSSATIVENTVKASEALTDVVEETNKAADRYGAMGNSLQELARDLRTLEDAILRNIEGFTTASADLEETVANVQRFTDEGVSQAMDKIRSEMEAAIRDLVRGLEEVAGSPLQELTNILVEDLSTIIDRFPEQVNELSDRMESTHRKTIKAYEESSNEVITAVTEGMTDLTDRLYASLASLTSRLPDEIGTVTHALVTTRRRLKDSAKSLDDAVRQLKAQTPQALAAQLTEFDHALAEAMGHFSGTLASWDEKITELNRFAASIENFGRVIEQNARNARDKDEELVEATNV